MTDGNSPWTPPAEPAISYVEPPPDQSDWSPPPPFPPERKRRTLRNVLLIGVGVFAVVGVGAALNDDSREGSGQGTSDRQAELVEVEAREPRAVQPPAPASDLTPSQQNAIRSAESYLEFMAFSRQGLIDQLSSEYGDQFSVADATFAVDSLNVNWNQQAAKSAESYLEMMAFSCQGLIDQLSSEFGDKYTVAQARYGATQAGLC